MVGACQKANQSEDLVFGEDGRQAFGFFSADGLDGSFQVLFEHVAIEEQQGAERLVLCGGSDVLLHGQVGEEGFDFRDAHVARVLFMVEQDVAPDPADVGLFGADRVVFEADGVADLVEEFFGAFVHL